MGLHEEAAEAFEQAAADPDLEAESRELWGRALRLAGRPEESTRVLHAALAIRPESLGVRYQLALSLEDAGEAEEAMRLHRSILREDPNFEDCRARTEALGGSDCTPRSPGTSG
jgi:tetratricopeptide (TPR) repeat protein